MNEQAQKVAEGVVEAQREAIRENLRKMGLMKKDEVISTKSGIEYNLIVILESKELAEKAIRGLVDAMDLQEEGFVEELKKLKDEVERRNKKMKEYEEIKNLAVKETCKEKSARVRLELLHEGCLARNEALMEKLTLKNIKIQELEKVARERASEVILLQDQVSTLLKDNEFWRDNAKRSLESSISQDAPAQG